jgi:hypothetical protein
MPARAKEGRHDRLLRDLWLEQPMERHRENQAIIDASKGKGGAA